MNQRNLAFVDTETTGLDDERHEIIDVAVILTDPSGVNVKERFSTRIMPRRLADAEPEALKINQFSDALWLAGPLMTHQAAAEAVYRITNNAILVGQNVGFDIGFLRRLITLELKTPVAWHYHSVDTASLGWPLFSSGRAPGLSLGKLCAAAGVPYTNAHTALGDAESCRQLYLKLMRS